MSYLESDVRAAGEAVKRAYNLGRSEGYTEGFKVGCQHGIDRERARYSPERPVVYRGPLGDGPGDVRPGPVQQQPQSHPSYPDLRSAQAGSGWTSSTVGWGTIRQSTVLQGTAMGSQAFDLSDVGGPGQAGPYDPVVGQIDLGRGDKVVSVPPSPALRATGQAPADRQLSFSFDLPGLEPAP